MKGSETFHTSLPPFHCHIHILHDMQMTVLSCLQIHYKENKTPPSTHAHPCFLLPIFSIFPPLLSQTVTSSHMIARKVKQTGSPLPPWAQNVPPWAQNGSNLGPKRSHLGSKKVPPWAQKASSIGPESFMLGPQKAPSLGHKKLHPWGPALTPKGFSQAAGLRRLNKTGPHWRTAACQMLFPLYTAIPHPLHSPLMHKSRVPGEEDDAMF
eukprot:TRINITY_DN6054_c0_g1_i2.p1 TRINITY_DN6054_c0_g1~~TRINITY_DN6054_c0_g1_i2.p1  ORF type:complete len:210 (+),score=1.66 TRINITY_DN6054_c0_g1_i2:266-895(+)